MKSVIAQNLYVSKLPSELPKSRGAFKIDRMSVTQGI